MIYSTTREFLKKFGFKSLKDLPEVAEFEELRRTPEEAEINDQIAIDFNEDEN